MIKTHFILGSKSADSPSAVSPALLHSQASLFKGFQPKVTAGSKQFSIYGAGFEKKCVRLVFLFCLLQLSSLLPLNTGVDLSSSCQTFSELKIPSSVCGGFGQTHGLCRPQSNDSMGRSTADELTETIVLIQNHFLFCRALWGLPPILGTTGFFTVYWH